MRIRLERPLLALLTLLVLACGTAPAEATQFDLSGPTLEVRVQRGDRTLPIAQVPALAEGDRLWLHPVLGTNQSTRYVMVAAFLRGSTNPPPDSWFTRVETWSKPVQAEGVYITVPAGAEQAIVFLAPQTGGDFSTLRNAVRGRPGSFVRASQDLNEASLDRARLDTYLAAVRAERDPARLKEDSTMLARSLSLKLDQQCFDKQSDEQAPCLLQNQDQMILDNGRSQTATAALTNGPSGDLALQLGSTPQGNYGFYNGYVATALDIARILDTLHTAQFQYIPALATDQDLAMHLRLNSPPSFHNPKSVLVIALPPVASAPAPALEALDSKTVCASREPLVLGVEGSPAVFATDYAHDLTLHVSGEDGKAVDLPVRPDAARGGFVVNSAALKEAGLTGKLAASVRGFYGFAPYTGPAFKLVTDSDAAWKLAEVDKNALVVGRDDELHLSSPAAACVDAVAFKTADGSEHDADWKLAKPDEITARLGLKDEKPGELTLEIREAGLSTPRTVTLTSLSEAGKLDAFTIHSGDREGRLSGTRLDEVASLTLQVPGAKALEFAAGRLSRSGTTDALTMAAPAPVFAHQGRETAHVALKDGRTLEVPVTIEGPRPQLTLLNKFVEGPPATQPGSTVDALGPIHLTDPDEVPLSSRLTFAVKAPEAFARDEGIEVATVDGLASTTFSIENGKLTLQDTRTAIASFEPDKVLGNSAFGKLQFRPVLGDGTAGNWQPLATLVRLPVLNAFTCPADGKPCVLTGKDLFLLEAVATDSRFTHPVEVPDGFGGSALEVPPAPAAAGELYLKLRDDTAAVNTVTLPTPPAATPTPTSAPASTEKAAPPQETPLPHP